MNQKEYILIAETLREYKENEIESLKFGYTKTDVDRVLAVIEDLESRFIDRLRDEYSNFNERMFREATVPSNNNDLL